MLYHAWEILLALGRKEEVVFSISITAAAVIATWVIKFVIHGRSFGWHHVMMGSDLCLSGMLLALAEVGRAIADTDRLLKMPNHPAIPDLTQTIMPAVAIMGVSALFLLITVNIERLAHESPANSTFRRFATDMAFGALVAMTAVLALIGRTI